MIKSEKRYLCQNGPVWATKGLEVRFSAIVSLRMHKLDITDFGYYVSYDMWKLMLVKVLALNWGRYMAS